MKINKMARIAVRTGEHLSMQLHLLVEAISQSIWVETRTVLKKRKRGMISL